MTISKLQMKIFHLNERRAPLAFHRLPHGMPELPR